MTDAAANTVADVIALSELSTDAVTNAIANRVVDRLAATPPLSTGLPPTTLREAPTFQWDPDNKSARAVAPPPITPHGSQTFHGAPADPADLPPDAVTETTADIRCA